MNTKSKPAKLVSSVFTLDQIQAILGSITARSATGMRNRALLAVLFAAGLRVSEAVNLLPADIDHEKNQVLVRHGKGNKTRRVGILPALLPFLQCWLEKRASLGFNGREPIFCTFSAGETRKQSGDAISPSYVRGFLARLQKKMPEGMRLHTHAFRHSLANLLVERGINLSTISAQLGHSSTAVTDHYLRKISPQELCAAIAAIPMDKMQVN